MKFERKHYIYILIAIILSLTAIAEEQTISSELANFTEINTSRIFKIWDTSTSEILLYEDALYLSHVNGGVNEIRITSTTTEFNNPIDMLGNDINNCGNCGGSDNLTWQNSKMNKSGDNMTGFFQFKNSTNWNVSIGSFGYEDLTYLGQPHRQFQAVAVGRIWNRTCLCWNNGSYMDNEAAALGFDTQVPGTEPTFKMQWFKQNTTSYQYWYSSSYKDTEILQGNFTITSKNGTGNALAYIDSNGKLLRNNLAEAGNSGMSYLCRHNINGTIFSSNTACDLI